MSKLDNPPINEESDKSILYRVGSRAKSFQTWLERFVMLVNRERTSSQKVDAPLRRRLWLWRHGFLTEAGVYFDLSEETVDDYLSNYQRDVKTKDINGRSGRILDDKLVFHQLLAGKFAEYLPNLYAYTLDGTFYSIDLNGRTDVKAALIEKLEEGNGLVCKPRVGGGGEGVYIIEPDGDEYRINGKEVALEEVNDILELIEEYLIYEKVQQAEYASAIYPNSTNTIRVLTMIDPETGEPFVGAVSHRFGADSSAPVDNWSSGGITSEIDRSTGELGPAARWQKGNGMHWLDAHPDSGFEITGKIVPEWAVIIDSLLQIAGQFPYLPYIGWDIVITGDDGRFKIIEGNRYSDIRMLQIHEPMLSDDYVRRFYDMYDI